MAYGNGTFGVNTDHFNRHLESFLSGVQKITDDYMDHNYPGLDRAEMSTSTGSRYIKVIRRDGPGRSVHAFVDRTNGDVLKPASWKKPAKHARGNIFDKDNGLGSMGPYGPAYLRG